MEISVRDLTLQKRNKYCHGLLLLMFCFTGPSVLSVQPNEIILSNEYWSVKVLPGTLEMSAELRGRNETLLSKGQPNLGEVSDVVRTGNQVQWSLERKGVKVKVQLNREDLSIQFFSEKIGTFTWPILQETANMKALIWPRWEGCYIPLDDSRWKDYLVEHEGWDTLEGLSMPFWGLYCGSFSLTYIITNPYNNVIDFSRTESKLEARFSHEFTPLQSKKEYGFLIRLGDDSSPVEPAKQFRRRLIEQGKFVGMQEKIKKVPEAARLLGAPHIYLWGGAFLTRHDIHTNKWRAFCQKLVEQSKAGQPSPGKRIKQLMEPERWAEVIEISNAQHPYKYLKNQVADELSRLLERPDFYDEACWRNVDLPEEATILLKKGTNGLTTAEICRMNGLILRAGFPEFMLAAAEWGDGVSIKMLE
ncbi:MAG: hypothetical protein WAV28_05765, partial [Sedimentisphaerales bacterium]